MFDLLLKLHQAIKVVASISTIFSPTPHLTSNSKVRLQSTFFPMVMEALFLVLQNNKNNLDFVHFNFSV